MASRRRKKGNLMTILLVVGVGAAVFFFHDKLRDLLGKITGMFSKKL